MKKIFLFLAIILFAFHSASFATEVTSINITGVRAPIEGFQPRNFLPEFEASAIGIESFNKQWIRDGSKVVDTYEYFVKDKEYFLNIWFTLEEGYSISDDVVVTVADTPKRIVKDFRGSYNSIKIYYDSVPSYLVNFFPQNKESVIERRVPEGGLVELPEEPEYIGYIFGGWYINGGSTPFDETQPITTSLNVYAKWNTGYTVTDAELSISGSFNPVYGEEITFPNVTLVSTTPIEALPYTSIKKGVYHDRYIWEDEIAENHTTFETGDYRLIIKICFESECKLDYTNFSYPTMPNGVSFNDRVIEDKAILFKLKYNIPGYTVTFNSMGGSDVPSYTDVIPGSKINKPTDPTREGYKFFDWYTEPELITPFYFAGTEINSNTTLYARWQYIVKDVAVTGFVKPIIGKKANEMPEPKVPENAPYEIHSFNWKHSEAPYKLLDEDEVFEADKQYYAEIRIQPVSPNNIFYNNQMDSATINGSTELVWPQYTKFETGYYLITTYDIDPVKEVLLGDLDSNKKIEIIDVRLLLQAYINASSSSNWSDEQLAVMDMNADRNIDIIDVRLLLQLYINS